MIDISARKRLLDEKRNNLLVQAILSKQNPPEEKEVLPFLEKIGKALVVIYNTIKNVKVVFPKNYLVSGTVNVGEIRKIPPVQINNLKDLEKYFLLLEKRIGQLATAISLVSVDRGKKEDIIVDFSELKQSLLSIENKIGKVSQVSQKEIKIPKLEFPKIEFPKQELKLDKVVEALKLIEEKLDKIPKPSEVSSSREVVVTNFPPQFTPQPVTNFNINALQGFIHTTSATVSANLTPLPTYGVLDNRRTLIIYNNSTQTVFIGGSDVSTSNGLPVPQKTYSPPIDAGVKMILYGVVSSGTADIRVMEVSTENSGR